jgi:hypothetical protein
MYPLNKAYDGYIECINTTFKVFFHVYIGYNIDNDILVKGNTMGTPLLTLHFCPMHNLLFFPSLQEWLSCTPVQIEHAYGNVLGLRDSPCPRCLTIHEAGDRQVSGVYASV